MTIPTTSNKIEYTGDASTKNFPYDFPIFEDSDLEVYVDDTLQTLNSDYTISEESSASGAYGKITFTTAPSLNSEILIKRILPLTQETDYVANDSLPAEVLEDDLDRLIAIEQQQQEQLDRAIKFGKGSSSDADDYDFPEPEANKIIGWNSTANNLENKTDESVQAGIYRDEAGVQRNLAHTWQRWARKFASNNENIPVSAGAWSSKHWSMKSRKFANNPYNVAISGSTYSARHHAKISERYAQLGEDVPVSAGKFSSKHWAIKSRDFANKEWNNAISGSDYSSKHYAKQSERYAQLGEDVPVSAGKFSSKHWSLKARDWANREYNNPISGSDYSSKHYATMSKHFSDYGEDNPVSAGAYSARHWMKKARLFAVNKYNNPISGSAYSSRHWAKQAERFSTLGEDVPVSAGDYSARHWMQKSRKFATNDYQVAISGSDYSAKSWARQSQKWAVHPEDSIVSGSKYSAYHWAKKAAADVGASSALPYPSGGSSGQILQVSGSDYKITGEELTSDKSARLLKVNRSGDGYNLSPKGSYGDHLITNENEDSLVSVPLAGRRNLIINGAMQIAQRGTSFSLSNGDSNEYTLDRWRFNENGAIGSTVVFSQSTEVPNIGGFGYSMKISPSTAEGTVSNDETMRIQQFIEAQNLQHLSWGTSAAKNITISFWLKSNKTGTMGVSVSQSDSGRYYIHDITISDNQWNKYSFTIPGDTSGTINNDYNEGIGLAFCLFGGSTYQAAADTWLASADFCTTNQTNFMDNTSNEIYITGVQLELGNVATPFEPRTFAEEELLCMRYFERWTDYTSEMLGAGHCNTTTTARVVWFYTVKKRTVNPTFSYSNVGNIRIIRDNSGDYLSAISTSYAGSNSVRLDVTIGSANLTQNAGCILILSADSCYVEMDDEF